MEIEDYSIEYLINNAGYGSMPNIYEEEILKKFTALTKFLKTYGLQSAKNYAESNEITLNQILYVLSCAQSIDSIPKQLAGNRMQIIKSLGKKLEEAALIKEGELKNKRKN